MAITGMVGAVFAQTSDDPVVFADEVTIADIAKKRYTISDMTKCYWNKDAALIVKKDGVAIASGYSIEYVGGVIVFDEAQGEAIITVSGEALTVEQAGGFFNWSVEAKLATEDVTTFESDGWKEFKATLKEFSGGAEAYWGNSSFFDKLGTECIIVFYIDAGASKTRFEGFALITGDSLDSPNDGIVQEGIDIQGTGPLYYREG